MAPDSAEETTLTTHEEIARNVAGQMPSMAVFSETQQVSSAEKQSELAWQQAQLAIAQRRSRAPSDRMPLIVAVLVVVALVGAFFVVRGGSSDAPSLTTPANDLPWRSVAIYAGWTVELPGAATTSPISSEIGVGTRDATTIPGLTIAVSAYRADYGMRGAGAAAMDLLKAKAADLGDYDAAGRITKNRDRWGDAYDLTVIDDEPIARLRAIVAGTTLFVIEVDGPQTERTEQIFSRLVNTLAPKNT